MRTGKDNRTRGIPSLTLGARRTAALEDSRAVAPGFTLIEMLVAVGAVALVGVAIATVFEAVGKTVGTGKRMATLNSYATLVQQQMERDAASMTRQGYLVIRNEMAGDFDPAAGDAPPPIPLHADDLNPRPRRIDEIMFFTKGDFTTAREALDPRFIARSDAASIYYGMGKRRRATATTGSEYASPTLNEDNGGNDPDNQNSWLGQQVAGNPNRFASDWTLLRLVRVLAAERTTQVIPPGTSVFGVNVGTGRLDDGDNQVGLQPAAATLFRALNSTFPVTANPGQIIRPGIPAWNNAWQRPAFASGVVDIATTSLEQVRLIVTTADTGPAAAPGPFTWQAAGNDFFAPVTGNAGDPNDNPDGSNAGVDGKSRRAAFAPTSGLDHELVARMQAWMMDGFPAWNDASGSNFNRRARVRYEPEPPNYLGVLALPDTPPDQLLLKAEQRADQLMLSSSNFVPRCTEFIVEWSFGKAWPSEPTSPVYWAGHEGELIWHGMERLADGVPPTQLFQREESVARPYTPTFPSATGQVWKPQAQTMSERFRKVDGTYGAYLPGGAAALGMQLIHGQGFNPANLNPGSPLTSYFGYNDPTFNPDQDWPNPPNTPDGLLVSPGDAASPTVPWSWPKFIRVTIGLADPNDPSFEQRYQFVFTLPEEPAP